MWNWNIVAAALVLLGGTVTTQGAGLERVRVADGGKWFELAESKKPFVPWGHNYGNAGRLMEDFWEADWKTLADDFAEIRATGANVVRVHLQFDKFMAAADRADEKGLAQLGKLLKLAEETGIYLDVTGLACYRTKDVPAWYDAMDEKERWGAQAVFWEAVAGRCKDSPAVFCYDLMNEPLVPGGKRKAGEWYSGKLLGGYDFLQWIALDQGNRRRDEIAAEWIKAMSAAIRKQDGRAMITVGLLPWVEKWGHMSGFVPETVAPHLDFVSVHVYPEAGKVEAAIEGLKKFAVGKPLVVEETFPFSCGAEDLKKFLIALRGIAWGWIGHYDGTTVAEYDRLRESPTGLTMQQAKWREWLVVFDELTPAMTQPPTPGPKAAPDGR